VESRKQERRPRRSFSNEFKAEVVELVRRPGNTAAGVARELDLTETAVREWVKQADIDDGRRDGLTSAEREELTRLRKEVRVLREERDILKRATAFFVREAR
jgi:transposase